MFRNNRFTLSFHYYSQKNPLNHVDLFIERFGKATLLTYQFSLNNFKKNAIAQQISDHRFIYLTYTGIIRNNRGRIRILKQGTYQELEIFCKLSEGQKVKITCQPETQLIPFIKGMWKNTKFKNNFEKIKLYDILDGSGLETLPPQKEKPLTPETPIQGPIPVPVKQESQTPIQAPSTTVTTVTPPSGGLDIVIDFGNEVKTIGSENSPANNQIQPSSSQQGNSAYRVQPVEMPITILEVPELILDETGKPSIKYDS
jgi:hypothetical protein